MTGPRAPIRAVVVADDPRVRHAMAGLLRAGGDIGIVEEGRIEDVAGAPVAEVRPELVVIDLGGHDLETAASLVGRARVGYREATVVVVGDPAMAPRLMEAGADEYVSRLERPECLAAVVRSVRHTARGHAGEEPDWAAPDGVRGQQSTALDAPETP